MKKIAKNHPDYVAHKYTEALWLLAQAAEIVEQITYEFGFNNYDNTDAIITISRSLEMNRAYAIDFQKNMNSFTDSL